MRRFVFIMITLFFLIGSMYAMRLPQQDWQLNVTFNIPEIYYIQINGTALNFDVRFRGFTHNNMWQINNIPLTYVISANGSPKKLTAHLTEDMPQGVELSMRITEPDGARAYPGYVEITGTPKDVLNDIQNVHNQLRSMDFQLRAANDAPVMTVQRTITFTLREQ